MKFFGNPELVNKEVLVFYTIMVILSFTKTTPPFGTVSRNLLKCVKGTVLMTLLAV